MKKLQEIIRNYRNNFAAILPIDLNKNSVLKLDLSVNNPELSDIKEIDTAILAGYINQKLVKSGKIVAMGGYGENRVVYKNFEHFGNDENIRSIHLGIDIWCDENTGVSAPMESVVHSFNDNDNQGDYGPTIILEHNIEEQSFYSLFGHLTKESLKNINAGVKIRKGETFAWIGNSDENGNWPPHLHFQLISDMGGYSGDFPGVSSEGEKDKWLEICPDPECFFIKNEVWNPE